MDRCWCGNAELSEYSEHYWKCDKCHSLVDKEDIAYDPESIRDDSDFYGKDYWEVKMVSAAQTKGMSEVVDLYLRERAVYWLKTLFRYLLPGNGSVAEVGCGLGQFSYLLKECGFRQTAYELSPEICEYIRKTLGIHVECGSLKKTDEPLDAIVAFDVIEHLTDPKSFMKTASESLKQGGLLLIQTPNYNPVLSYQKMQDVCPKFEEQLRVSEHVHLFSKESARKLLDEFGFTYVVFFDAFFGNDYDMFFVASREPLTEHTEEEIGTALNRLENGRLVKALINAWSEARDNRKSAAELERQGQSHLKQISELTEMVRNREERLRTVEADREERSNQIAELTEMVKQREERLRTVEADREERSNQIAVLTELAKHEAEERIKSETCLLGQVTELTDMVNDLRNRLAVSEADREERLKQIITLTETIHQKEAEEPSQKKKE